MLEGELTAGVLPTLLRDLYVGRRTGLLYLRNGGVERCVRFREGRIVGASSSATAEHLGELNNQLTRLADLITRESRDLSTLSASQDDLRGLIRQLAQQPAQGAQFSEDLCVELRLLSRIIGAALGGAGGGKAD